MCASGAILHLTELQQWHDDLVRLHGYLNGIARLDCMEPNLRARIELKNGRGALEVELTPDHMAQSHRFSFEVDQSHLPALISALARMLKTHPIRARPD
ncbi:MAG: hypothetical protein U1D55_12650 [Phycisphaerae bacterium]